MSIMGFSFQGRKIHILHTLRNCVKTVFRVILGAALVSYELKVIDLNLFYDPAIYQNSILVENHWWYYEK